MIYSICYKHLLTFAAASAIIVFSNQLFCMDNSQLAEFAGSYQVTGNEPAVYSYEDTDCGLTEVVLVKTINLNNGQIGGVTFQGSCWGALFTYFEMDQNSKSIRALSQVSAGRSEGFSNWSPSAIADIKFTSEQLKLIAKLLNKQHNVEAESPKAFAQEMMEPEILGQYGENIGGNSDLFNSCHLAINKYFFDRLKSYSENPKSIEDLCPDFYKNAIVFIEGLKNSGLTKKEIEDTPECFRAKKVPDSVCIRVWSGHRAISDIAKAMKPLEDGTIKKLSDSAKPFYEMQEKYKNDNDLTRKVLNYSNFGDEEGLENNLIHAFVFWYPLDKNECVYAKAQMLVDMSDLSNSLDLESSVLSLNSIDPRNIKINRKGSVFLDDQARFDCASCSTERLKRGWSKIYADFCTGQHKEF